MIRKRYLNFKYYAFTVMEKATLALTIHRHTKRSDGGWYGTDCQMTKQRRRRVEKKDKLSYDTLVSV